MRRLTEEELREMVGKVGAPRPRSRKLQLDMDLARAMIGQGFSWAQVAEYMGVSKATVLRRLKESRHSVV